MRSASPAAVLASLVAVSCIAAPLVCGVACGAGQTAQEGAQSSAGAFPSADSGAGAASPSEIASTGPTTTSSTLGEAGDAQGVKLAETHAAAPAGGAPAPKALPHAHDAGRGPADIRALVVAHRDEARACYDHALADHPGIEGDIVITWTIDPKGHVTDASLDSSRSQIAEATLVACLSDILTKIQFAQSPGGFETKAFYPFNFHPHHKKQPQ